MSRPELHRGKLAKHPRILSVRPLVREDLAVLREKRVGPPRTKLLRETHHRIARLIAAGYRDSEIMRMTQYTPSRIGALRQDPAMQELIAQYRGKVNEAFERQMDYMAQSMVELKVRGLEMLHDHFDRAEEDGELIPIKSLLPIVSDMADRTGHGKQSLSRVEKVDFAAMMKEIARKSGRSNVIDATPVASTPREITNVPSESPMEQPIPNAVGFRRRV